MPTAIKVLSIRLFIGHQWHCSSGGDGHQLFQKGQAGILADGPYPPKYTFLIVNLPNTVGPKPL